MSNRAYLAFETGGTKLVAAVADADGALLETRLLSRNPHDRAQDSLSQILTAGQTLRIKHEAEGRKFAGIGFGYGGQVSRSAQRVLRNPHEEGWEDIDVRAELTRQFNLPSVMENDCKLSALAEAMLGAGRGYRTVFYITIGTGIGGGIVRDGQIVDFGDTGEAEIGHITVMAQEGFPCGCGKSGCLETIASGPGMAVFAKKLAKDHPGDWKGNAVSQRALHDKRFSAKDLMEAYEQHDLFAGVTLRVTATMAALAIAPVIQLINPDVMIFGGGVGSASDRYVNLIGEVVEPFVMPSLRGHCKFVRTQLREQVVTQGAALLAAQAWEMGSEA